MGFNCLNFEEAVYFLPLSSLQKLLVGTHFFINLYETNNTNTDPKKGVPVVAKMLFPQED